MGEAEAFDADLVSLVRAANRLLHSQPGPYAEGSPLAQLFNAVEQMEPWLEQDDPRANGWVDDRGRP